MKVKMLQNQPGPSSQKKGKSKRKKRNLEREQGTQTVRKKQMQQRAESPKEETTSLYAKVVKVTPGQKAKWQLLPKSTRVHLESMMKWLIISVLYENTENHRETEKHLNLLKKRLLKRFETLRVPVQKLSILEKVHSILAEEKKKSVALEEDLSHLQEEIDKAVQAAELREESILSLQNKVQELKCELAAEEETASELFQQEYSGDLDLPELSKRSMEAPILQEQMLKIPNPDGVLQYLNLIHQHQEQACEQAES